MGPAAGGKYEMLCRKEINSVLILGYSYNMQCVSVYGYPITRCDRLWCIEYYVSAMIEARILRVERGSNLPPEGQPLRREMRHAT